MRLIPIRLPGSKARKVRAFGAEIRQLRAQGYTFEAIREALAEAGMHVSNSTVQREAARAATPHASIASAVADSQGEHPMQLPLAPVTMASVETAPGTYVPDSLARARSGKEIAEAFVRSRSTNPLIRAKENL